MKRDLSLSAGPVQSDTVIILFASWFHSHVHAERARGKAASTAGQSQAAVLPLRSQSTLQRAFLHHALLQYSERD